VAYRLAPIQVTLNDVEAHSLGASFSKWCLSQLLSLQLIQRASGSLRVSWASWFTRQRKYQRPFKSNCVKCLQLTTNPRIIIPSRLEKPTVMVWLWLPVYLFHVQLDWNYKSAKDLRKYFQRAWVDSDRCFWRYSRIAIARHMLTYVARHMLLTKNHSPRTFKLDTVSMVWRVASQIKYW